MELDDLLESAGSLEGLSILLALSATAALQVFHWSAARYRRIDAEAGGVPSSRGLTGAQVVERLRVECGLTDLKVAADAAHNHYDPQTRTVMLRRDIHDSPSLAALATAAHEVGHAQQFAEHAPLSRARRNGPLLIWGLLLSGALFLAAGTTFIAWQAAVAAFLGTCFAAVAVSAAVILPLERDASRRARGIVERANLLLPAERPAFERLLGAAWLTYAAAIAQQTIALVVATVALLALPALLDGTELDGAEVSAVEVPDSTTFSPVPAQPVVGELSD